MTGVAKETKEDASPDELRVLAAGRVSKEELLEIMAAGVPSFRKDDELRVSLMRLVFRVAAADNGISEAEMDRILSVAQVFGGTRRELYLSGLMYYRPATETANRNAAAEILGISPNSSLADAKVAYRKAALVYHPDKLQGLAPEIVKLAQQKFIEIQTAYKAFESGTSAEILWGRTSDGAVGKVEQGQAIQCFFCPQKYTAPDSSQHRVIRCTECRTLLLFEPELAEALNASCTQRGS